MRYLFLLLFLCGCLGQIDQLAGRHWIKHPETGEKVWAPASITPENWDSERKVWVYPSGEICGDGYLYDND